MSMTKSQTIALFGASGFIGRYIVQQLAGQGHTLRVAARRPKEAIHLKTAGDVGQIALMPYRGLQSVEEIMAGADAAVSLAGILYESRADDFDRVHHQLPARIAELAAHMDMSALVHISAIGADPAAKSVYAQSKGHGEAAVTGNFPSATILRPSIVFGPEDNFFNQFANMARFAPFLPLIGGGKTKFQPVYVNDVARAAVEALTNTAHQGKVFELGGPDVMSFEECLRFILTHTGRRKPLITIPLGIARLKAMVLEKLPQPPLTRDQLILLESDNVVSDGALTLADLGIEAASVEAIVPHYLQALSIGQPMAEAS